MSDLLSQILEDLRQQQIEYEEFLRKIAAVAKQVQVGRATDTPPALNTPGKRALFNNLGRNEQLALLIDETVRAVKQDGFKGNSAKERMVKAALLPLLGGSVAEVERIFQIILMQTEY
jgi:type I restriction enzyme R subunit